MSAITMAARNVQGAQASCMSTQASYLSVSRLCKSYDGLGRAVDGVDLQIRKGEFVTLLGPSGSGKTTTLSMIAGFEQPSDGDISINGRSLVSVPVHQRNIGVVFQNYALFPHMTAQENVAFPLRMRKVNTQDAMGRAKRALASVGLSGHLEKLPTQMSGGQQQRVALARALVFEPDVLLLDEPLSALDKNLREQMQLEIKRLHTELRMTTLFVTHDQSEAMAMSDRIAVFNSGKIEQFDAPLTVYERPATRFVATFIGDSNLFDIVIDDPAEGRVHSELLGAVRALPSTLPAGARAQLMVRPEAMTFAPLREPGQERGVFTVESVLNYGDRALVHGKVGRQDVKAMAVNLDPGLVHTGARLAMSWPHDQAYVLAD
ncbi:Spermidine/putrescine import ATP-binding protein PotA [Bordetella pseudohinzii]|uniref:Spermidine/putrescine import ATP-binding protein PotA n=2 Tax=Bordetella pseudohinzii TaxID=1331258 RepID=A0A0M9I8D5_9BORD|nr:Spermidine/putrescine import ATP-binding protein PotA [Bordetella pseudohinzii]